MKLIRIIKLVDNFKHTIYNWAIDNLPTCIMYKYVFIDSQHQMWIPRFGWSKKQILNAEKSIEKYKDLKFDN